MAQWGNRYGRKPTDSRDRTGLGPLAAGPMRTCQNGESVSPISDRRSEVAAGTSAAAEKPVAAPMPRVPEVRGFAYGAASGPSNLGGPKGLRQVDTPIPAGPARAEQSLHVKRRRRSIESTPSVQIEFGPDRHMIGRLLPTARELSMPSPPAIHRPAAKAADVDADAVVLLPGAGLIVPERVDARPGSGRRGWRRVSPRLPSAATPSGFRAGTARRSCQISGRLARPSVPE